MNEFFTLAWDTVYVVTGVTFVIACMLTIGKWVMDLIDEMKL